MKKTVCFGLGGLAKGLIEALDSKIYPDVAVDYIYLDAEYKTQETYEGIPIISSLKGLDASYCVIPTFEYTLRKKWITLAQQYNLENINIKHKSAYISKTAKIGKYCFIGQNNIIESGTSIGDYFICGYQNRIGHDSVIGDFCHVFAQVNIGGFNRIGNNVCFASSSATREGTIIEDNCFIGMGSVVFKNIPSGSTTIGNPARIVK